jgi:hypothetical protein
MSIAVPSSASAIEEGIARKDNQPVEAVTRRGDDGRIIDDR